MAGSDVFSTYILSSTIAAADPNGVCLTQSTGGAANLSINGALTSGSVATLVPARNATITSGGSSETGKTFTFTGTDAKFAFEYFCGCVENLKYFRPFSIAEIGGSKAQMGIYLNV